MHKIKIPKRQATKISNRKTFHRSVHYNLTIRILPKQLFNQIANIVLLHISKFYNFQLLKSIKMPTNSTSVAFVFKTGKWDNPTKDYHALMFYISIVPRIGLLNKINAQCVKSLSSNEFFLLNSYKLRPIFHFYSFLI